MSRDRISGADFAAVLREVATSIEIDHERRFYFASIDSEDGHVVVESTVRATEEDGFAIILSILKTLKRRLLPHPNCTCQRCTMSEIRFIQAQAALQLLRYTPKEPHP